MSRNGDRVGVGDGDGDRDRARRRRRVLRRGRELAVYLLGPVLGAVASLATLPAVTATHGAAGWAAVALGQSLGGTAGVAVELGWGVDGVQRTARQAARNVARTSAAALATKLVVGVPVTVLAAVVAAALSGGRPLVAALVTIATVLPAFANGWALMGQGRAVTLLLGETLPRSCSFLLATAVLLLGGSLTAFAVVLLLGCACLPVVSAALVGVRPADVTRLRLRRVLVLVRAQTHALTSRVASAVYASFAITIVAVAALSLIHI